MNARLEHDATGRRGQGADRRNVERWALVIGLLVGTAGALLTFALGTETSNGWDINAIGIVLMTLGAFGLVVALVRARARVADGTGPPRGERVIDDLSQ